MPEASSPARLVEQQSPESRCLYMTPCRDFPRTNDIFVPHLSKEARMKTSHKKLRGVGTSMKSQVRVRLEMLPIPENLCLS